MYMYMQCYRIVTSIYFNLNDIESDDADDHEEVDELMQQDVIDKRLDALAKDATSIADTSNKSGIMISIIILISAITKLSLFLY